MNLLKTLLFSLIVVFAAQSALAQIVVPVAPADSLHLAIQFANDNPGSADILELTEANGIYALPPVDINYPIIIRSADPANPAVIHATEGIAQNDYITINEDLTLQDVIVDGTTEAGNYAQYKFMLKINNPPDNSPINEAPELVVMNCHLRNVYQSGDPNTAQDGTFFDISRTSYAGLVHFENTTLENSGDEAIRSINAHKDPVHPNGTAIGALIIRNCTFNNIRGTAVKVESDGDVATDDGELTIENVTFYQCQRRVIWERDYANSTFRNLIIADSRIGNDTFNEETRSLITHQREGSTVSHVDTFNISGVKSWGDTVTVSNQPILTKGGDWSNDPRTGDTEWTTVYEYDPMFVDPENGDFTLAAGSRLYTLGHDGGALGDRRWATNPPAEPTVVAVAAADGLVNAIDFAIANPGAADILELTDEGGQYELGPVNITVPLTIRSINPDNPAVIHAADTMEQNDWITINEDVNFKDVIIDAQGISGTYAKVKYMLKVNNPPENSPLNPAPRIRVYNSTLRNIYQSGDPATATDGTFFDISRTSWVGSLHFENVLFENSGDEAVRSINANKDPIHPNNGAIGALTIRNCTFNNIRGSAIKLESDVDSLTMDSKVTVENATFYQCQRRVIWQREHEYSIFRNLLIVDSRIGNDTFGGTDALISVQRRGTTVSYVDTFAIQGVKAWGDTVVLGEPFVATGGSRTGSVDVATIVDSTIYDLDPMFADPASGDFMVGNATLLAAGHDGGLLGSDWMGGRLVGIEEDTRVSNIPAEYSLEQNYPNPFNPTTTIKYSLKQTSKVELEVYNILGALVGTLVNDVRQAGEYKIVWNASEYASGVYFYRLKVNGEVSNVKKMMLLK